MAMGVVKVAVVQNSVSGQVSALPQVAASTALVMVRDREDEFTC